MQSGIRRLIQTLRALQVGFTLISSILDFFACPSVMFIVSNDYLKMNKNVHRNTLHGTTSRVLRHLQKNHLTVLIHRRQDLAYNLASPTDLSLISRRRKFLFSVLPSCSRMTPMKILMMVSLRYRWQIILPLTKTKRLHLQRHRKRKGPPLP